MTNCPWNRMAWAEIMLKTDAYWRLMEVHNLPAIIIPLLILLIICLLIRLLILRLFLLLNFLLILLLLLLLLPLRQRAS